MSIQRSNGPRVHCVACGATGLHVTFAGPAGHATRAPPGWWVVLRTHDREIAVCSLACAGALIDPEAVRTPESVYAAACRE